MPLTVAIGRREQFFQKCCLSLIALSPVFYGVGALQGGRRGTITAVAMTLIVAISGCSWWLTHRGRMAAAIDLFCGAICAVIVVGCFVSGRAGLVVFLLLTVQVVASIHRETHRMLIVFSMVGVSAAIIAATQPPIDPSQLPTLFALLLFTGAMTFFSSRANEMNYAEVEAANAELQLERNRAEAANEAKSRFLTTMSHELRTPLNAVIGYTEMVKQSIEEDDLVPEEALRDLTQIEIAGRRLLTHVSRILDLTQIEASPDATLEWVATQPLLDELETLHSPIAEARGLSLSIAPATSQVARVRSDAARLSHILQNLIDNAIRFTDDGGVTVTVRAQDNDVVFGVSDTGLGIAPEDQGRIFDVFTQVDGSYTRTAEGVGLGLALCKRLADSVGGHLKLESEPGRGTQVELRIPMAG